MKSTPDSQHSPCWRVIRVLGLMALLAGGIWAVAELIDLIHPGAIRTFDAQVLLAMRSPGDPSDPIGAPWLESLARDITALGSVGILSLLMGAISGYLLLSRRSRIATYLLVAVASGALLSFGLKAVFQRSRPDVVPHIAYASTASFPSGHTMMSAVTYLTLAVFLARVEDRHRVRTYLLLLAAVLTLLVGVSRVYLGVHWPTDVVAGWAFGAAWALLWWWAARSLQPEMVDRAAD